MEKLKGLLGGNASILCTSRLGCLLAHWKQGRFGQDSVGKSRKWKKDPAHLDTAPTRIQEQSDPIQKPTGKGAGDLDSEGESTERTILAAT
ncbi:hypothetical protein DV515_00018166, partial [Chloebia gouldiae]